MTRFESLERWSAAAFLAAGALLAGFAARNAVIAFGGGFPPQTTQALYLVFVVPAELAAYVGLLGLYPRLADRVPRNAGLGALLAVIGTVAVLGFGASATADLFAAMSRPSPVSQVLFLVTLLSTVLGFVVLSVASLRARISRRVGLLLLVPPATYVVMLAGMVVGYAPEWSTFALSATQAGAHLALGVALRSRSDAANSPEQSVDSAAR